MKDVFDYVTDFTEILYQDVLKFSVTSIIVPSPRTGRKLWPSKDLFHAILSTQYENILGTRHVCWIKLCHLFDERLFFCN